MKPTFITAIVFGLCTQVVGQESDDPTDMIKTLQSFYRNVAPRYEFILEEDQVAAKLEPQPIMSWTGQEAGTVSGDVFVWTRNGRAEVVGCIGSLPGDGTARGVFHEFHSLTTKKSIMPVDLLTGRKWTPATVGIKPSVVPDAAAPADKPVRRLTQMRQIAREFVPRMQVTLQLGNDAGNHIGQEQLRLLPQPLYRYNAEAITDHPDVIDGAIFTYVWARGTDPELLLLLEARKTDEGTNWTYAPVRFTFRELWLDHKEQEVWHHKGGNGRDTYAHPYVTEFERTYSLTEIKQLNSEK